VTSVIAAFDSSATGRLQAEHTDVIVFSKGDLLGSVSLREKALDSALDVVLGLNPNAKWVVADKGQVPLEWLTGRESDKPPPLEVASADHESVAHMNRELQSQTFCAKPVKPAPVDAWDLLSFLLSLDSMQLLRVKGIVRVAVLLQTKGSVKLALEPHQVSVAEQKDGDCTVALASTADPGLHRVRLRNLAVHAINVAFGRVDIQPLQVAADQVLSLTLVGWQLPSPKELAAAAEKFLRLPLEPVT